MDPGDPMLNGWDLWLFRFCRLFSSQSGMDTSIVICLNSPENKIAESTLWIFTKAHKMQGIISANYNNSETWIKGSFAW